MSDPIIIKNTYVTQTANVEASEKADVSCKIFQPLKWVELVHKDSFATEKNNNE